MSLQAQAQRSVRYSPQETVKIYTDWANHYLERGGCKRRVTDLQADLCDGVLLADLVEAVTNQKVIDVNRKPKSAQQMVENVSLCVGALRVLGADVGAVNPGELSTGSTLRPVLALLFALSRHKQRAKQLQDMPRLPSPYNKQTGAGGPGCGPGGTSIPLPATVAATRRCPPDKVRPAPAPAHQTQLVGLKHGNGGIGSASSSRSTSPSQQQPPPGLSFIPQPRSQGSTNRQPTATTPSPRASTVGRPGGLRAPQPSPYSGQPAPSQQQNKNSVLDKFKLFNNKEKNQERGKASSAVSKRTSSSSGFSSARSEHSDSSTSLCDQSKTQVESPKTRALKSKLQVKTGKQASPKSGRKEQTKAQSKIARTKGSEKLVYAPSPAEDAKTGSKIANAGAKLPDKKVNNFDLPKQSGQLQKSNSSLTAPTTQQKAHPQFTPDVKIVASSKPEQKSIQRPKMELPGKIADAKINQQNHKGLPNGLSKDVLGSKGLPPNSNGLIKLPTNEVVAHMDNPTSLENEPIEFDKTITTMNRANINLSEEKMVANVEKCGNDSDSNNCRSANYETRGKVCDNHIGASETEQQESSSRDNKTEITDEKTAENTGSAQIESPNSTACKTATINGSALPGPGQNSQGQTVTGPGASPGSSIPKPTALVKGTTKQQKEINIPNIPNAAKLKGDSLHRKLDPNTVAMVSPMPSISDLMSESSHSNSNSTGQSNSSDSSVIYRPSSESGSEIKTIPNRKIDTTFEQMEKVLADSSPCVGGTVPEEEAEMTVKPMQPLLRGYTPGARCLQTLPTRTTARQYTVLHSSSHHHVGQDYADIDIASGYLSDGEVLRGGMSVGSRAFSDLSDGYMSEGGASLYARRINPSYGHEHDRYVGGSRRELSGVKELVSSGSRRVQKRPSASSRDVGGCGAGLLGGCSGGSDALAELTIEDLASIPAGNHSSAHGHPSHHKRVPGGGTVVVGGGVGSGSATPQGTQQVYRVVNSRHPGSGHHPHVKKSDSAQQTENSAFKHQQQQQNVNNSPNSSNSNSQQWKKYIEVGAARDREREKDGAPSSPSPSRRSQDKHRKQAMAEYANGEKPQKVSSGTSTGSGSSSKVRGVPQSFGYVKRHSAGTSPSPNGVQNGGKDPTRTAQVSAVPRTKVKVSGGTQTCTTELQANSSSSTGNPGHHPKSYSLTGPSASQLSQSVRDRLMLGSQSLPKPGSPEFTALFAAAHHRDRGSGGSGGGGGTGPTASSFSTRVLKPSDGSLSDTCSNYAAPDIHGYYSPNSPYSTSWMRHSNTYTPSGRSQGMGLCEADSVESLGSHRASLTHARLLMHQRDSSGSPAPPRLNRSNSIRSTKSEKMYPSMLARGSGASSSVGEEGVGMGIGGEPYYSVPVGSTGGAGQHWSQPTSPTPTHTSRQPPNLYQHVHKDDDIHGSSVSLVSTASSLYSSAEEKQAHELRKLRRELVDAQEKVHTLTSQLSVNALKMDLNICSRRVHDGYATIRSRGRSRPRAVYRSDSEELLKDAGGPYALPHVSNSQIAPEAIHRVPRWSDAGQNKMLENYGTLRRGPKFSDVELQERREEKVILNTFSSSKNNLDREKSVKTNGELANERLYDTVPSEETANNREATEANSEIDRNPVTNQNPIIERRNNFYDAVTPDECPKKMVRRRSEVIKNKVEGSREGPAKTGWTKDSRQPIYAVPNILRSNSEKKFDCRLTTDGNYVPSGDLYRTTARYIEDINRNIAEIDKSYEELRCSSSLNGGNAAYGVINKIPRCSDPSIGNTSDENLYSGFHRKRDTLVPMPPISPNFGENGDDRASAASNLVTSHPKDARQGSRFDFKIPRNPSNDSSRESTRTRPNSYGKLPPKLLPRSSSIENNFSRHSTGSTTTSSSNRSTESLYAICETLTGLPRDENTRQSPRKNNRGEFAKRSVSYEANSGYGDVFVTMRAPRMEVDVHSANYQGISQDDAIVNDPKKTYQRDGFQSVSTIRRNRIYNHGDGSERTDYGKSSSKINCGNRITNADSTTLRVKDRNSYRAPAVYSTTNASSADSQSRSSGQEKIVDLHSEDETDERKGNRGKNEKTIVSGRAATRSNKYRSRALASGSTGTIRRIRSSSATEDNDEVDRDSNMDDDEETSLLGHKKTDRKPKISPASGATSKHCWNKARNGSNRVPMEIETEQNPFQERRYGTLPYRRSKNSSRPLHKSSEDVLDGERMERDDAMTFQRTCISTLDVRAQEDDIRMFGNGNPKMESLPFYMMDATEVILKGQLERRIQDDRLAGEETLVIMENESSTLKSFDSCFIEDNENVFKPKIERLVKSILPPSHHSRTRHNSLEYDDAETSARSPSTRYHGNGVSGFATLPRRGNISKEQRVNNETPRRLSGNVLGLEPLYEHAVSNPVKPRGNDDNFIPWWELATRKYRHRSCPALQDHVVQAFEQSLANMNQRLKHLTATAEKKDSELQELRDTIERLRKQSAEAGLNGAASNGRRHTLGDSDSGTTGCAGYSNHQAPSMARQLSADSVTSLNSLSSACSASSNRKKKGWLGSFSKKFSRSRKNRHGSVSDAEDCKDGHGADNSAPNSPRLPTAAKHEHAQNAQKEIAKANGQQKSSPEHENPMTGSKSSSALYKKEEEDVDELKKQLRQKDLVLTEITLEALSLKNEVYKMKNQMNNLKQNNERLQQLVTSKSLTSSQSSLPNDPERRFSVAALSNGDHHTGNSDQMEDLNVAEHAVVATYATTTTSETVIEQDTDGKRINVAVYLGSEKSFNVNLVSGNNDEGVGEPPHCVIASVCISNKTSWDSLDSTVRRCFKDYVSRVDPVTNLGLGVDYVAAYHLGEASRYTNDSQHPELLPCGYLIGHVKTIYLVLSGYSWLAVDTLIPKSIVQRLVSLLTEHRRLILCGPSGTGKSYLAGKLAHALVDADADSDAKDAAAVATFNVDHKSSKELTQYLAHIAERCDSNAADELPKVIILENLQHAASLGELFSGLLGTRHSTCPAIIGTMSQAACSTTNLQLHHNFRWVLCRKDMEPVKGFLSRYLRRKLLEQQLRETASARNAEMAAVVEWLPRLWLHLNKFLETHSSSDVTIGPSLFLSCPMEVAGSQVWFTDLWNYSIIPYLVEAVKEGNGEAAWEDPTQFITTSYPWIATHAVHGGSDALRHLRPEDVGYDVVSSGHNSGVGASSVRSLGSTHSDTEGDPLLNMLMRLQEAANYSSPHSNDSDSVTSMDSSHTRHSEDLSTSTSSSRGVESAL